VAWIRRKLRDAEVFVRVDDAGRPAAGPDGRVDIVYRLAAEAPIYRASVRNLIATGDPADEIPRDADGPAVGARRAGDGDAAPAAARGAAGPRRGGRATGRSGGAAAPAPADADTIIIYTDGACSGNPGPMGLGAVILDRGRRRELSEYLGVGTNNIAELTAIERALDAVPPAERGRRILLHTDSGYAIGVVSQGWKAKANADLIGRLREQIAQFPRLEFVKVAGHAGVPENERCDELARDAILRWR
jgi:ribonuclease HI